MSQFEVLENSRLDHLGIVAGVLKDLDIGTYFTSVLDSGVKPELFNRHRLERVLDSIFEKGCSELFSVAAAMVAKKEGLDTSAQVNDTTSFSVSEKYDSDWQEESDQLSVTYGHSKDHRPDLKQVIHELVVTCDGGVPQSKNFKRKP